MPDRAVSPCLSSFRIVPASSMRWSACRSAAGPRKVQGSTTAAGNKKRADQMRPTACSRSAAQCSLGRRLQPESVYNALYGGNVALAAEVRGPTTHCAGGSFVRRLGLASIAANSSARRCARSARRADPAPAHPLETIQHLSWQWSKLTTIIIETAVMDYGANAGRDRPVPAIAPCSVNRKQERPRLPGTRGDPRVLLSILREKVAKAPHGSPSRASPLQLACPSATMKVLNGSQVRYE